MSNWPKGIVTSDRKFEESLPERGMNISLKLFDNLTYNMASMAYKPLTPSFFASQYSLVGLWMLVITVFGARQKSPGQ